MLKVSFKGLNRERRRYSRRSLSRFRKEQKARMRQAGKVLLKEARASIRSTFATHGSARRRGLTGSASKTLSQATKLSVRSKRTVITAIVGAKGKQGAYGKVLEEGRTVSRKSRSGGTHSATYPRKPWLQPAVDRSESQVVGIVGRSFKVV